jgi:hypothetical protein
MWLGNPWFDADLSEDPTTGFVLGFVGTIGGRTVCLFLSVSRIVAVLV